MKARIGVVGHEATRSGAPILLREVVRNLKDRPGLTVSVLLNRGGEILKDYEAIARTSVVLGGSHSSRLVRAVRRGFGRDSLAVATERAVRGLGDVDLAYINTSLLGHYASAFKARGSRVITHVHEVGEFIQRRVPPASLRAMLQSTDTFIVVSRAVAQDLTTMWSVPRDKIIVVHGGVESPPPRDPMVVGALRESLGIPPEAMVVGSVGGRTWAKGPDIFVQVARRVLAKLDGSRDVRFVWVGGSDESEFSQHARYELERSDMGGSFSFVSAVTDPNPWFYMFDVYAMTSRAEALGLAMLETGVRGIPTVAFAGAGGAPEFVRCDAGRTVPFLDVESMADALLELLLDDAARSQAGLVAAERAQAEHSLPDMLETIHGIVLAELNQR